MTIHIDEKKGLVYLGIDEYEGMVKAIQDHETRIRNLELKVG